MRHLFDRISEFHAILPRVETEFVVVYEDGEPPAKILIPAPEWMAMALHGGILPPVSHYHVERDKYRDAEGNFTGPKNYWTDECYTPIGPLTEEEAIHYLILKDIDPKVWREGSNYPLIICRRSQLPKTRIWRNCWRVKR